MLVRLLLLLLNRHDTGRQRLRQRLILRQLLALCVGALLLRALRGLVDALRSVGVFMCECVWDEAQESGADTNGLR